MKKDGLEGLERIVWTPANKMEFIEKMNNDGKRYYYYKVFDGTGQLALKWTTEKTTSGEIAKDGEAYTRDPQGNTLATYKISNTGALTLAEQPIYGAARIGMYKPDNEVIANLDAPFAPKEVYPIYGNRSYEISNHLGNVLAVVSDQKDANGKAVIIDKQDYYAFGSPLPKYENIKDETLFEINGTTTTLATQIFTGSGTSSNPVAVVSSTRTFQTPLVELQAGYYTYTGELAGCSTLPNVINYGFNSEANATQVCTLVGNKFTITFTASEAQRKLFIKVPVSEGCSGAVQLRGLKLTRLQGKTVYQNNFTQPAVNWTYNGGALNVCTSGCTTSVGNIPYTGIVIDKNKLLIKRLEGLTPNQDYVARISVKNLPTPATGDGISILISDAGGEHLENDRKVVSVTNETLVIEVAFRATNTVHQFIYSTSSDFYTIISSLTLERRKADNKPSTAFFANPDATNSILTCAGCAYSQQVGDVKVNTQTANVVQFNHIVTPNATYNLTFNIDWSNVDPACTARTLELSTNGGITYTPVAIESGLNTTANINFTAPATISYPVLLRFSCAGVNLTNINYTVLRSAELVNDSFKSPDVNSINTLGYEYFNETNTTSSTAELSKETVIVGGEQYKILQIAPTSGTTRLQKVYSGLEIGKTYRVAVILPRTTYNVTHDGTTYQVQNTRLEDKALQVTMPNGVGIGMKDAYYAVAIPNYTFPANSKAGRGLTPDGNYHYWISFVATAPTATVTYLGASNNIFPTESSSTPGGYRLKNAGGRQILGFTLHQKIPTEEDGDGDGYRYGFNTQQKQDDIYGPGNQNTALYWEYDTRLGRRWNIEPLIFKYPSNSGYLVLANNPIIHFDKMGDDIVYFNRHGVEVSRIVSNTVFKTYIPNLSNNQDVLTRINNAIGIISYIEVPMPKIILYRPGTNEQTSSPEYQKYDYIIAARTGLFNQSKNNGTLQLYTTGGNPIPKSENNQIPDLDPTLVKAMAIQESHAGTTKDDILSANHPGDFNEKKNHEKKAYGLHKTDALNVNNSLYFGLRILATKGFVGGVGYDPKSGITTYQFKGWENAIKSYGPPNEATNYQSDVLEMIKESKEPVPTNY